MSKHHRIGEVVRAIGVDVATEPALAGLHPCYAGWFVCFNRGDYYEAHDVLEHLWLGDRGRDRRFYQGLIQLAGAFVHMRKQQEEPTHPKHSGRLRPASRLLALARRNLTPYEPAHLGLDVAALILFASRLEKELAEGGFVRNPLEIGAVPKILPNRPVGEVEANACCAGDSPF